MGFVQDFKDFAMKGSILDLAVGIVIGTAFGAVIKSLVDEIIMPIAGYFMGGKDFSNLYFVLGGGSGLTGDETLADARASGAAVLGWGQFVNIIITFLIIAFVVFMLVRTVNRVRAKEEAEPEPTERPCPECLSDIPRAASRCKSCSAAVTPLP